MSDVYSIKKSTLDAIANAIREKTGGTDLLDPETGMPSAILGIEASADTSDATAVAADIALGTTAYIAEGLVEGTSPFKFKAKTTATMPVTDRGGWTKIAYGAGKFVSLMKNTSIGAYSEDGITWTQINLPKSIEWVAVAYGADKFVAIGYGSSTTNSFYSTDGITWTQGNLYEGYMYSDITYGDDKFVIVSEKCYYAQYSTDGITWKSRDMPSKQYAITFGNGKFVAVGSYSTASNNMAYSSDGLTWTQGTMSFSGRWSGVVFGNDKFVAVACANGNGAYSEDGTTWTRMNMPSAGQWYSIVYGSGKFVVFQNGNGAKLSESAFSDDGISWTANQLPVPTHDYPRVIYENGKFFCLPQAANQPSVIYSNDGVKWQTGIYEYGVTLADGLSISVDGYPAKMLTIKDGQLTLE